MTDTIQIGDRVTHVRWPDSQGEVWKLGPRRASVTWDIAKTHTTAKKFSGAKRAHCLISNLRKVPK